MYSAYLSPPIVVIKKKKQPAIQETYKSPILLYTDTLLLQRPFLQNKNMQQVTFLLCRGQNFKNKQKTKLNTSLFSKSQLFKLVLDFKKLQNKRDFPYTLYPVSPIVNIFHNVSVTTNEEILINTLVLFTKVHILCRFSQTSPNILFLPQNPIEDTLHTCHVSFGSLGTVAVVQTFLGFDDLDSLEAYWSGTLQNWWVC